MQSEALKNILKINRMKIHDGAVRRKPYESVLKDIVYAEVYNRKVIIHTRDTNIEYYGKLQELSEIAGADFFVHTEPTSYISNMFRNMMQIV